MQNKHNSSKNSIKLNFYPNKLVNGYLFLSLNFTNTDTLSVANDEEFVFLR